MWAYIHSWQLEQSHKRSIVGEEGWWIIAKCIEYWCSSNIGQLDGWEWTWVWLVGIDIEKIVVLDSE